MTSLLAPLFASKDTEKESSVVNDENEEPSEDGAAGETPQQQEKNQSPENQKHQRKVEQLNRANNENNEAEEVPNKFSLPEFINNYNDQEINNLDLPANLATDNAGDTGHDASDGLDNTGGNQTTHQGQEKQHTDEISPLDIPTNNNTNDNLALADNNPKSNLMVSPSSTKKHRLKTPVTPTFRNFFTNDSPRINHTDNAEATGASENEINWLKRLSKFNHSEPNFNDWKTNFFPFNKRNQQASQGPKGSKRGTKPPTRKEKLSESDRFARARANFLIDSLFLGYTATNLVSSVFLLDEEQTRRAPLLGHLIGIKIYDITDNFYNPAHHHHRIGTSNDGDGKKSDKSIVARDTTGSGISSFPTNSRNPPKKHRRFRLDMEYGVGENRAKWTLIKNYREIVSFAIRVKFLYTGIGNNLNLKKNTAKLAIPKFPKLKGQNHGFPDSSSGSELSSDEDEMSDNDEVFNINKQLGGNRNRRSLENQESSRHHQESPQHHKRHTDDNHPESPQHFKRNTDDNSTDLYAGDEIGNQLSVVASRNSRASRNSMNSHLQQIISTISNMSLRERRNRAKLQKPDDIDYTKKLEKYFKKLFLELSLRPQSNKLFQFFELSPVGILLSNEHGYRGKQGYLLIATSAKSQGWRVGHLRARDWGAMIKRHTLKWFCIRESYIIYVSDINSTTILDVFLVDESFKLKYSGDNNYASEVSEILSEADASDEDDEQLVSEEVSKHAEDKTTPHFNITVENRERKMKMVAKSAYELKLWIKSIKIMQSKTEWALPKRFGSFAPVRENCFAQWFVDARDYWWAASSAIEMAKDVIFIHDWWLSPELYLRRPPNGNQEWRIDRLLKRKAEQGVKIFIIVYRNIGDFVVIDSSWTKHSLMDLHENIRVLRSPNQFLQNTFFWAHHEKLLIIDHTIAFLGGIDLCYGRYDTPEHVLVDDAPTAFPDPNKRASKNAKYQVFPGKDYSNPRVKDFFELDKPYESMYDRQVIPRMPWHDVHMVNAGQIARDLSRHFVQRWNYLIRQKRPSRPTPLLTPPTNLTSKEIEEMGFKGSCEVQLLRSSGYWSLGLKETEHSIQNAYLKLIETSEHFVYLENQFFVTACAWDNVVIKNRIGDALVDRIIRAHKEGSAWRAMIVIPLMPGFEAQVDEPEGSSVRVIMQCQYMSISRGSTSIFAKLRKVGIDPDNYIQFFSLRKWGKIGEYGKLVSEQLYIHAKTMVVDDRVAIIGSANINERSMRGSRDSEICAVIRDTATIKTTMNGQPYLAGKFAHTLRMRLMREHLGIHVDQLELVERQFDAVEKLVRNNFEQVKDQHVTGNFSNDENAIRSAMVEMASREILNLPDGTNKWKRFQKSNENYNSGQHVNGNSNQQTVVRIGTEPLYQSFNHRAWVENIGLRDKKQFSSDPRIKNNEAHKADVAGKGADKLDTKSFSKWKLNARATLKKWALESASSKKFQSMFVPNLDHVKDFLDNDDELLQDHSGKQLTEEEEEILAQRDQERWEMLKRIAYIQRVIAKFEKDLQEENAKRVKVGLEPKNIHISSGSETSETLQQAEKSTNSHKQGESINNGHQSSNGHQLPNGYHHFEQYHSANVPQVTTANGKPTAPDGLTLDANRGIIHDEGTKPDSGTLRNDTESLSESSKDPDLSKKPAAGNENSAAYQAAESASRDIPITSLDDNEIEDIFTNQLKIGKARFIDPYSFSDPLDDEFYEDIWFENAYRNTKIFRLVFHCQPDNAVATWNEYKDTHKLMKAFSLAQDYEIEALRDNVSKTSEDLSEEEEEEYEEPDPDYSVGKMDGEKRPGIKTHRTSRSIRLNDINTDGIGVLGMPPDEMRAYEEQQQQQQQQQRSQKRMKFAKLANRRKGSTGDIGSPYSNNYNGFTDDQIDEGPEDDHLNNSTGYNENNTSNEDNGVEEIPNGISNSNAESDSVDESGYSDAKNGVNGTAKANHQNKSVSKSSSFHDQSTINNGARNGSHYANSHHLKGGSIRRRRTGTSRRHKHLLHKDMIFDKETADKILSEITGHLVLFPVNWLYKELESNNWFTNSDRLPPIEIYD